MKQKPRGLTALLNWTYGQGNLFTDTWPSYKIWTRLDIRKKKKKKNSVKNQWYPSEKILYSGNLLAKIFLLHISV